MDAVYHTATAVEHKETHPKERGSSTQEQIPFYIYIAIKLHASLAAQPYSGIVWTVVIPFKIN